MRFCIGTASLGLDYGIQGFTKPTKEESIDILSYAIECGFAAIDTACVYGDAEDIVGDFFKRNPLLRDRIYLTTKINPVALEETNISNYQDVIGSEISLSLKRLGVDYVDAIMFHNSSLISNGDAIDCLFERKGDFVRNVGISLYDFEDAISSLSDPRIGIIQFPFSLVDQRLQTIEKQQLDTVIAARSIFTQGLIFMDLDKIPENISGIKPYLNEFNDISKKYGYTKEEIAVQYVLNKEFIDFIVLGVNNIEQIDMFVRATEKKVDDSVLCEISKIFENIDTELILPNRWGKR